MCGIAGYVLTNRTEEQVDDIVKMTRILAHRGPDDAGISLIDPVLGSMRSFATDESAQGLSSLDRVDHGDRHAHRIAFGHRRFSIIDTSVRGHQPFWSSDGRVCVAFNGEIYNYLELRQTLERLGHRFTTSSDTEVMVQAYIEWGESCFSRMNGFWALTLYDAERRAVLLARDRIGKAPLYLFRNHRGLFWASEIKALGEVFPTEAFGINEQALAAFVASGERDRGHQTLYREIESFPAASWAWVRADGSFEPVRYWRVPERRLSTAEISFDDATAQCRELLHDAMRIRMRADVPVGFELSGGLDSSAIVGSAGSRFDTPLDVFTVAWPDSALNEEPFARMVASRYANVRYNVITPPDDELIDDLDSFVALMEQPFRTPSVYTYQSILRSMQSAGLRVSINGTGGDENFAGYAVYRSAYLRRLAQRRDFMAMSRELDPSPDGSTQHSPFALAGNLAALGRRKAARTLAVALPSLRRSDVRRPELSGGFRPPPGLEEGAGSPTDIDGLLVDFMGDGLMNYWQRVVNQASMGVPIEVRSPFLDYRVVEFSFQLPLEYLMKDGWSKWILRHAMSDVLPDDVTWRRQKSGFPFPAAEWLNLHKDQLLTLLDGVDSPYLDSRRTRDDFSELAACDPLRLWRIVSVGLWWKRCVQNEPLS